MPSIRLASILVLAWMTACGGKTGAEHGDAATNDATTPPAACSWPSTFEAVDAEPMRDSCRAGRSLVSCTGSDGTLTMCITDKDECDFRHAPGVSFTCKKACKPTEFAATCGNVMGSSVVPPAACAVGMPTPGGIFYCCACSM
jgi:hypothetical protein